MSGTRNTTLFTGSNRALLGRLCTRLDEVWDADPLREARLVVPNHLVGRDVASHVAERRGAWANLRISTLEELAGALAAERFARTGLRPLSALHRRILITSIVRGAKLGYLEAMRGRPGFIDALDALFHDLEEAGVGAWDELPERIVDKRKAADLGALYGAFRARIDGVYFTDLELYRYAEDAAAAVCFEEVALYGFADFHFSQRRLLCALGDACRVAILLPFRPGKAFSHVRPLIEFAKKELDAGHVELPLDDGSATALDIARSRFFEEPQEDWQPAPDDGTVKIVSAPHEFAEAEQVVREVMRLVGNGARFSDIAIAFPGDEQKTNLARQFETAGLCGADGREIRVPLYVDGGLAAAASRAGRALVRLAGLMTGPFDRSEVAGLLRLCAPGEAGGPDGKPCRTRPHAWDRIAREAGIARGDGAWETRLRRWKEVKGSRSRDAAADVFHLERRLAPLLAARRAIDRNASLAEVFAAVRAAARTLVDDGPARSAFLSGIDGIEADEAVFDSIESRDVPGILTSLAEAAGGGAGRYRDGTLALIPLQRVRQLRFRHLIIAGLTEAQVPSLGRQDPMLLDSERQAINRKFGCGRLAIKAERYAEQAYLFRQAMASASESVTFTFPRNDRASGRQRVVSHFLTYIAEALCGRIGDGVLDAVPGLRRVAAERLPEDVGEAAARPAEWEFARVIDALKKGEPVGPSLRAVSRGVARILARRAARIRSLLIDPGLSPYDGALRKSALQWFDPNALLGGEVSATRLETYAACPRRFFLRYALGLDELEDPGEATHLDPLARGAVVHDVLREVFETAREDGRLPFGTADERWFSEAVAAALDERGARLLESSVVRSPLFWELDRRAIERDLATQFHDEMEKSAGTTPRAFEVRFGKARGDEAESPDSSDEPAELVLDDGRAVRFGGRIDRVDATPGGGLRVIDYKSGKFRLKKDSRLAGGELLQLPVYELAARHLFGDKAAGGVGAYYYHNTKKGGFRMAGVGPAEWGEVRAAFSRAVATILDGVAAGLFFPNPNRGGQDRANCRYCPYVPYCGPGIGRIAARKAADPVREPFETMKEIA